MSNETDWTQLTIPSVVRDYLRGVADEEGKTYSELALDILPEGSDIEHGYTTDEVVTLKLSPDAKDRLDRLTGDRIDQRDIIALYAVIHAASNDNLELAADAADHIPMLLWDIVAAIEDDTNE